MANYLWLVVQTTVCRTGRLSLSRRLNHELQTAGPGNTFEDEDDDDDENEWNREPPIANRQRANGQPPTANRQPPTANCKPPTPLPSGSNVNCVRSLEHPDRVKRWSIGNQDTLLAD